MMLGIFEKIPLQIMVSVKKTLIQNMKYITEIMNALNGQLALTDLNLHKSCKFS